MKRIVLLALSIAFLPLIAHAQISISARLSDSIVVQYEAVVVSVEIVNHTGQTLFFGGSNQNAKLAFSVEQTPGLLLPTTGNPMVSDDFVLEPNRRANRKINLLAGYSLASTGPYTVTARVDWDGHSFRSSRMFLDVVPGFRLAHMTAAGPDGGTRTYSLRTLNRNRNERLFFRVDDEHRGVCLSVTELGRIVRFRPPRMEMDEDGMIHVLHQTGPARFIHSLVTPDGLVLEQQHCSGEAVFLDVLSTGEIDVSGATSVELAPPPE